MLDILKIENVGLWAIMKKGELLSNRHISERWNICLRFGFFRSYRVASPQTFPTITNLCPQPPFDGHWSKSLNLLCYGP